MPKSLQHLINALLLHPSLAVGIPLGSKKVCSPLATLTNLPPATKPHSLVTIPFNTVISPRGTRPQPPGPNARFRIRR